MQVVNIQNVMVCLAVSIQYVCVTDGQTDILRRALVIYRRRRFINHLLTYLHSPHYAYASRGKNGPKLVSVS